MNRVILAKELRNRLLQKRLVSASLLTSVPDDAIIDSYVTCSACGARPESKLVQEAIDKSNSAQEFINLTSPRCPC